MPVLLVTKAKVIEGCPLCGLHRLAGFGKAAGECSGQGMLVDFRKALESYSVKAHLWILAMQRVSLVCACTLALGWEWTHIWTFLVRGCRCHCSFFRN